METQETLEEKVKNYLVANGITQRHLAGILGISAANMQATFAGKRKLKATELIKFCEHYNISINYFRG
jgi:transcriptional regulator with XRE-family HTH domain